MATSARRLYRLGLALAVLGTAAVAVPLLAALGRIQLEAPSTTALVRACREAIGGTSVGALVVLAISALGAVVAVRALRSLRRQLQSQRRFLDALEIVGLSELDGAELVVVADQRALAFCAGNLRPRIHLSTGAIAALSERQLQAVLAHERHHRDRRDPLRVLIARVLADAFFFLPALRRAADRYAALAEVAADEAAIERLGERRSLAGALLAFGEAANPAAVVGIAPERVDHLSGSPLGWELRISVVAGSVAAAASLIALGMSLSAGVVGQELTVASVVAQACMIAMVVVPLAIGAAALLASARLFARTR